MSSPRAASQNSARSVPKARRTLAQSVCHAIQPRSVALTPMRNNLLADIDDTFPRFRAGLKKPAVIFLNHVDHQSKAARLRHRRNHERQREALAGWHGRVEQSGASRRDALTLFVPQLKAEVHPGRARWLEKPGGGTGVVNAHAKANRIADAPSGF